MFSMYHLKTKRKEKIKHFLCINIKNVSYYKKNTYICNNQKKLNSVHINLHISTLINYKFHQPVTISISQRIKHESNQKKIPIIKH